MTPSLRAWALAAATLLLGLSFSPVAMAAAARVALVVGNSAYLDKPLENPTRDAAALAKALRGMGFEVLERLDRNPMQIRQDLRDFGARLGPGTTALFYFAGHGVQNSRGKNFLLPVGVKYEDEGDAETNGLDADGVVAKMRDTGASLNIVVLDACRDSPLPAKGRSMGSRGLGRMDAPSGSLIAFATASGSTADDNRGGKNGLYTQYLLDAISKPGLRLEDVFKQVRRNVEKASQGRQVPEELSKLTSEEPFYFIAPVASVSGGGAQTAEQREAQAWAEASAAHTELAYADYLRVYPQGRWAAQSKASLDNLKREARKTAASSTVSKPYQDCPDCPVLVNVPPGKFTSGNREYAISEALAVGVYEVTFREWDACVADKACDDDNDDEDWGRDDRPVINVRWDDAQAYVAWLSRKTGHTYRLLHEAEWEYVARAGSTSAYPWGANAGLNNANCQQCGAGNFSGRQTAPVGKLTRNAFGLHDVIGNVWEWTADCDAPAMKQAREAAADIASNCASRVLRGGSFKTAAQEATLDRRRPANRATRSNQNGFRVAREL